MRLRVNRVDFGAIIQERIRFLTKNAVSVNGMTDLRQAADFTGKSEST
jgi:hypothetical protein